jgi:hypothetical protein
MLDAVGALYLYLLPEVEVVLAFIFMFGPRPRG